MQHIYICSLSPLLVVLQRFYNFFYTHSIFRVIGVAATAVKIISKLQASEDIISAIIKQVHHERQKSQENNSETNFGAFTWNFSRYPTFSINRITKAENNAIISVIQTYSIINIPPGKLKFLLFSILRTGA